MKALFISIAIIIGIAATAVYYPIQTDATLTGEGTVESPLSVASTISTGTASLTGRAGGQTLIGGTATTDDLILQSTSGVGATGALIQMKVGNNGTTTAMTILNDGNIGIGTATPGSWKLAIEKNAASFSDMMSIFNSNASGIPYLAIGESGATNDALVWGFDNAGQVGGFWIWGNNLATGLALKGANVGISTTVPDKKLEVNLGTADAFRLTYNDANGSAANYMDVTLSSTGSPTFNAVGTTPMFTFSDPIIIPTATPASSGATGTAGQIAWDASYFYVCTATNTWTRIALAW